MPDDADTDGIVSRDDIIKLAPFFDASENALNPLSREAKEAKSEFENLVTELFQKVRGDSRYTSVAYSYFRGKIRLLCRQYLRKN
jgi:hypothetical protein